jgi:hypothetical protein
MFKLIYNNSYDLSEHYKTSCVMRTLLIQDGDMYVAASYLWGGSTLTRDNLLIGIIFPV